MLALALLWAGHMLSSPAPCWAPSRPAPTARWLLPRLIVEVGTGPAIGLKLSWRIGSEERDRSRKSRQGEAGPSRGPRLPEDLDQRLAVQEAEALERALSCQ